MTMNNEDINMVIVGEQEELPPSVTTAASTNEEGLHIIEEDEFTPQLSDEELANFYEEHKDAIDLIGGLEMFESLMSLDDEQFETLKPQILDLFNETLNDSTTEKELKIISFEQDYTPETIQKEFEVASKAIDEMNFLSEAKKEFLKQIYTLAANKLLSVSDSIYKTVFISCELEDGVKVPTYAHKTDAGLDIYAKEEITIMPGETKIIGTGIKMAIPEGYAILIQPRSGQSVKTKLRIANTPGLIDAGYRDEIGVIIENIEPPFKDIDYEFDDNGEIHIKSIEHGLSYTIVEGQRFAQMRLVQVPKAEFIKVESVGEIGEDRGGGFGSTGIG